MEVGRFGIFLLALLLLAGAVMCAPALAQGSTGVTVSVTVSPRVRVATDGTVTSNIPVSTLPAPGLLTVIAR